MNVCRGPNTVSLCTEKKGLHEAIKEEKGPVHKIRRVTTLGKTCVEFYEILGGKERSLTVLSENDMLTLMVLLNEMDRRV